MIHLLFNFNKWKSIEINEVFELNLKNLPTKLKISNYWLSVVFFLFFFIKNEKENQSPYCINFIKALRFKIQFKFLFFNHFF